MHTNNDEGVPWILHCGEAINGKNYNLIDALLFFYFGSFEWIYEKKETCFRNKSLSNQALRPFRDLRLHPYFGYHNNGIKCFINNDDPIL